MCGVAGGLNISNQDVEKMLETISHRGIDNYNIKKINNIILGVNILPIISNNRKNQPIVDMQKVGLVFNGEIYNYKDINLKYNLNIKDLNNDTNVLFRSLNAGLNNYNQLEGQFAFAYVENNKIHLVRDYPGISPLFYSIKDDKFAFASESKALESIGITEIKVVLPGTEIIYDCNKGNIHQNKWIELEKIEYQEPIDELDKLLNQVVRSQLTYGIRDNKVGILLSGGVDSALLAYYISLYNKDVIAFTIDGVDSEYAKEVCTKLNIQHIVIDAKKLFNNNSIEYKGNQYNQQFEPINNSLYVPTYIISQKAKQLGIKILYSGDGIDELFGGYDIHTGYEGWLNNISRNLLDTIHSYSLERYDLATMANTIEGRVPFLDRKIIEFALSLDEKYKMKDNNNKYIIRKIAERYLPKNIAWRDKIPMQVSTGSYKAIYRKEWGNSLMM